MSRRRFAVVAAHDLLLLRRDRLLAGTLVLLALLFAVALWSSATVVGEHRAAAQAFAADVAARQQALGRPVEATAIRRAVVLPDGPLAVLTLGRTRLDPFTLSANFSTRADQMFLNYQTDSPQALALGGFDPGFVVLTLLPLVVIALGYGLLASERDSGRLRLLLAAGATPSQLLGERAAVRAAVVLVPLLVTIALAVAVEAHGDTPPWGRLELWLLAAGIYLGFWWALVAAANRLPLRAEAIAVGLVSLWSAWALIVPALTAAIAVTVAPAPSRATLVADIRHAQTDILRGVDQRLAALERRQPQLAGGKGAEAFVKRSVIVRLGIEAAFQQRLAFEEAVMRQAAVARAAAWLSPTLSAAQAMVEAAGTDQARALAFRRQARAYKDALQRSLLVPTLRGEPVVGSDLRALPRFVITERRPTVPASLLLWGGLSLFLGVFALRSGRRT